VKDYSMTAKRKTTLFFWMVAPLVICANLLPSEQAPAPKITAIEPNSAITTPGTRIMVSGSNLSSDSIVYFGGIQAREISFVNSSAIQVTTPYLRPGRYKLDLKSAEAVTHSDIGFTALPAAVDSDVDRAEGLAKKQTNAAISVLTAIAASDPDYDVRAFAHYRAAQLYLAQDDYWHGGEEAGLIWDAKVSMGVQTSWRYRLLYDETAYALSDSSDHETDLRLADGSVKMDVTENPEPRFWRALLSARFRRMEQAKTDLNFVLAAESANPSYRALAAYIGVLAGADTALGVFRGQQISDARALGLLGQASYIAGDHESAQAWWTAEAKISTVWAKLNYLAGQKHLKYGQVSVGTALVAECAAVAPDSREGRGAKKILDDLVSRR
jgi:IPT/TIG domain